MRKTVLIVEDEFLIAIDLKLLLERRGWQVLGSVTTVQEALSLLGDELPSVALLDVTLRDGSVTLLAEALRAQNVPFVVASAYSKPELIGGEIMASAPNVAKPTEERRLLAVLEQVVRS
ncbi:DNA-binding response OmpR family regulator [Sinorhizobium fredii]|uniref:Response regulator receiver protein n=1 Tax=Sinorhizobium fredii (strain USDA 257) TaxID=1185652 RepID=I3X3V8_SINF2|nr:response regulator [Sinorhizobium fredii]AFL50564.1 response regulator receiver protein [Sinorhizobium fredii USDA 257]